MPAAIFEIAMDEGDIHIAWMPDTLGVEKTQKILYIGAICLQGIFRNSLFGDKVPVELLMQRMKKVRKRYFSVVVNRSIQAKCYAFF